MKFSLSVTKVPNTSTLDHQFLMRARYGDHCAMAYCHKRDDAWNAGIDFLREKSNAD